jgi:phosphohistidine swiveling domain-containing protein
MPLSPTMANPIHRAQCRADVAWSTINAGEAIPGVVTPMTWSFFGDATDRAMKLTFFDLGVIRRDQAVASPNPEDRLWDVFYGRAAANLNTFRWLGDRMPGTSGDAIEEQIFGQVRPGVQSRPDVSRYPFVAARMPISALRLTRRLTAASAPIDGWWRQVTAPGAIASIAQARDVLRTAARDFEAVMRPHTLAAMLCQAFYEQLRVAAERAGRPGLELSLVTGYGDMSETAVVTDLWSVSREQLSLDEFVRRHGYHGPDEGELSSRVWRINRAPLEALLTAYRELDDDRDPRLIERQRGEERRRAETELLAALPGPRRAATKLVARLAATFIPLRGTGKAAFLQCVDAARAAALAIGEQMVSDGQLDRPDDAFMFTLEELLAPVPGGPGDSGERAAERRAIHDEYRKLDIPDLFEGVPTAFPILTESEIGSDDGVDVVVTGTPVSPGVVEGAARRLIDPHTDDALEPGEILVCRTTDPSWASAMMLASALVIDIGGPISHGAIVARELGVPCVIGTRDGTAKIRSGDRLRVDGGKGEVVVLARVTATSPISLVDTVNEETVNRTRTREDTHMANHELLVLRTLRLKGRVNAEGIAAASGVGADEVNSIVTNLVQSGEAREMNGNYLLMPPGRDRLNGLLEAERAGIDSAAMHDVYEDFVAVNGDFKRLANDWQMKGETPNDHSDAAYDQEVLGRLPGIHERVSPVTDRAAQIAPRLAIYKDRFERALAKVQGGDLDWLLKPLIDSYHTVWFEFHEELIGLAGHTREAEAASGRAE